MSDRDDQHEHIFMRRRHFVARYGSFRIDRETSRFDGEMWRESSWLYVVLEATPRTEFDVGLGAPLSVSGLPYLLRYLHYRLHSMGPGLETGGTSFWPWRLRREASGEDDQNSPFDIPAPSPELGFVTNHEAVSLVAEALAELERAHPDLRPDPTDDYLFSDPEVARRVAAWHAEQEEWRRLHGEWPTPSEIEPGPLITRYGPFCVHAVMRNGTPLWHPDGERPWLNLIVFDGGADGTRLICTQDVRTQMLRHSDWEWVARYVATWLRFLADSLARGRKVLAQTADPEIRAQIEQGLTLRTRWYRLVRQALRQELATQNHARPLRAPSSPGA